MSLELREDRRELLRRLGRCVLLVGLSSTGIALALRRGSGPLPSGSGRLPSGSGRLPSGSGPPPPCGATCRGCAALRGCDRPAAVAHRRAERV
jgi:hypothetical protein